ncbi:hypothetical protein EV702DRAFT_1198680 [Suillus placidus]|uniref:Uncharacterized protein n=1 Tax=Suillus placidus TaxID=48579 RepID=A0A9P6ZTR6_9AGAM|nr:hypothetical protein EV702DRAFT_1198680 [Suillus placidus]
MGMSPPNARQAEVDDTFVCEHIFAYMDVLDVREDECAVVLACDWVGDIYEFIAVGRWRGQPHALEQVQMGPLHRQSCIIRICPYRPHLLSSHMVCPAATLASLTSGRHPPQQPLFSSSLTATSLGEKVIAIGNESATMTIEETETEKTAGEEMIEGTATGTWTDGTEIAMSINVVTESGTTTTVIDAETGRANGEDGTDEINMGNITPFIATSVLCAEHADRRLLDLYSFNST